MKERKGARQANWRERQRARGLQRAEYWLTPKERTRLDMTLKTLRGESKDNLSESAYIYGGNLYRTLSEAHIACAIGWISADGENSPEAILDSLDKRTDEQLVDELERTMEVGDLDWYSRGALLEAFRIVRQAPERAFRWDRDFVQGLKTEASNEL